MKIRAYSAATLLVTLAAGCTTATLKPPASVTGSQPLKVEGHSSVKTFKEKDLKIGSFAVTNIDRDWDKGSGVSSGPWAKTKGKKAYRFDVKGQERTLHAECTEEALTNAIGGFGKTNVTFGCACKEGEVQRVKLDLSNGTGAVQLADSINYKVSSLHESEQGARITDPLGYHFQAGEVEGVIDVSGNGRAWLPTAASEEDQFGLVCSYAALLLYRPTN